MGNWYCKCGNRMSDGLVPTPHGYEVFTSKQCCDGGLDDQRAYADVYICPECGRIMIFGRDQDQYLLYKAESLEDIGPVDDDVDKVIGEAKEGSDGNGRSASADDTSRIVTLFSDSAWEEYAELCSKKDDESTASVNDINRLIEKLRSEGTRELSVRNMLVGAEHQVCYMVKDGSIEIRSIEWLFE